MAACIVCNEETGSQDLNVSKMATICLRLEQVLDESVPCDALLCPACDFDLNQIEMYYTLLAIFKKRYYDTANRHRQQMKSTKKQASRNVLDESTEFSSKNLQGIFEASNSSANVDTLLPLQTETSKETCSSDIPALDTKLEINDVRSLQDSQQQNQIPDMLGNSEQMESVQRPTKDILINAEAFPGFSAPRQIIFQDSDTDDTVTDGEDFIQTEDMVLPNLIGTRRDNTKLDTIPTKSKGEEAQVEKSDSHDTPVDIQSKVTTLDAATLDAEFGGSKIVKRKRGRPRKYRQIEFPISNSVLDGGSIGSELLGVKKGGRPRNNTLTGVVKGTGSTVVSRKRGRPRKNDNAGFIPVTDSKVLIKKRGRTSSRSMASQNKGSRSQRIMSYHEPESEEAILEEGDFGNFGESSIIGDSEIGDMKELILPSNANPGTSSAIRAVPAQKKKLVRPRKNEHASIKTVIAEKDACTEAGVEGSNADALKLNERKKESVSPSNIAKMSPGFNRKRGRLRKVLDPDFAPVQHSKPKRKEKKAKNTTRKTKTSPACAICDEVFPDRSSLKSHMMTHTGDKTVLCTFCGKEFQSPSALEQHESVHTGKKRFQCEICGKGISRGSSLRMHLSSHNKVKSFECDKCNKKFKNQKYLESHINKHHVQGRHILCTVCGKAFFTEKVLKIHMLMHSGERVKSFKCKFCDMLFHTKGELGHHQGTHKDKTERQQHICPVCGKAFVQKFYLKYHMVSHTGESKHRCTDCDQVFKTASEHQRHMRKHTGEKPYKCSICGKAFRISSNLHAHKKIHTGERPHKCICGVSFRVKTMLDRHMGTKKHADFMEKMTGKSPTSVRVAVTAPIPTVEQHDLVTGYQSSPIFGTIRTSGT